MLTVIGMFEELEGAKINKSSHDIQSILEAVYTIDQTSSMLTSDNDHEMILTLECDEDWYLTMSTSKGENRMFVKRKRETYMKAAFQLWMVATCLERLAIDTK